MRFFFFLLFLLVGFAGKAQTARSGNGDFSSVTLETDTFAGWELTTNYYPLQNNIDRRTSSVFIAEMPSLNQIEAAAVKLPSHFFVVTRRGELVSMIALTEEPRRQYLGADFATGAPTSFPCTLAGDIPEERALELLDLGWDPNARITGNGFYFNHKTFSILPAATMKADVLELIANKKLAGRQPE